MFGSKLHLSGPVPSGAWRGKGAQCLVSLFECQPERVHHFEAHLKFGWLFLSVFDTFANKDSSVYINRLLSDSLCVGWYALWDCFEKVRPFVPLGTFRSLAIFTVTVFTLGFGWGSPNKRKPNGHIHSGGFHVRFRVAFTGHLKTKDFGDTDPRSLGHLFQSCSS